MGCTGSEGTLRSANPTATLSAGFSEYMLTSCWPGIELPSTPSALVSPIVVRAAASSWSLWLACKFSYRRAYRSAHVQHVEENSQPHDAIFTPPHSGNEACRTHQREKHWPNTRLRRTRSAKKRALPLAGKKLPFWSLDPDELNS